LILWSRAHRTKRAGVTLGLGSRSVETEKDFIDVVARRADEMLFAEVKGRTTSRPGVGADVIYGQLLRRMPTIEMNEPGTRFAVVAPETSESALLRVPARVRKALRIDLYVVTDEDEVQRVEEP
jgi:hypothetical protein